MKPPVFAYHRASSVQDALEVLAQHQDAKVIAGGQSMLPLLSLRLARPTVVVDIGGLSELERVFDDERRVLLGALVRHRTVETDPLLRRRLPLLAHAASHIGHVAIRNRGTIGGSLSHADPAAEFPAVMLALGGTFYLESSSRGRREVAAEDFFVSVFSTDAGSDELLTWVSVPALTQGSGWGFTEFAPRHGDYAEAGAACVVALDQSGAVRSVRAGLFSAGDTPLLRSATEVDDGIESETLWRALARSWADGLDLDLDEDPGHARSLHQEALLRSLRSAHHSAELSLLEGRNE